MNFGTWLLKTVLRGLGALPLKFHYFFGRLFGGMVEKMFHYRDNDLTINLSRAFPELGYAQIKELKRRFYRHFGELFAESLWFGGTRNGARVRREHIEEIVNPEELTRLAGLTSGGVMVMYAHSGNWELIGGILEYDYSGNPNPQTEQNVVVVYRKLSSPAWNEVMRSTRTAALSDPKHFPGYLESEQIARYIYEHRSERKFYYMITDQRPYFTVRDYVRVNFMGREVTTMSAAAALARKFGMPVTYLRTRQVRRGLYQLEYVPICDDPSTMTVGQIMQRYYELLEEEIRMQPWNYLWTHRRWA